jgi:hypothetical protein
MKKIIYSLSLLSLLSLQAHAGLVGLTWHSRANCGNNESISWDARWERTYITLSQHVHPEYGIAHEIITQLEDTIRSAAVHWGEAFPGNSWQVFGTHWMIDEDTGLEKRIGETYATDCSIYDGWWDQ